MFTIASCWNSTRLKPLVQVLCKDAVFASEAGAKGIVTGMLDSKGAVDLTKLQQLQALELAKVARLPDLTLFPC